MALHPEFPKSPYDVLLPEHRWFPADEEVREQGYEKLLPPLVCRIRREIQKWRESGYVGATETSRALLRWWFETEQADETLEPFRYYFAQREAVETVIWLYDVRAARDKYDLLRFDSSGAVSSGMFDEQWTRYVIKMATGAGKTKVLSLLITWCYFHKLYEPDSTLARNILLIAPNIIVLDRLKKDFGGKEIFFTDPVLPPNGREGRNWHDDFHMTVHIQDNVRNHPPTGNLFLTNIHRVYLGDVPEPSLDDENTLDYFLEPFGPRPKGKTTDSRTDLGEIVREIDELAVFNDEAHHIHDKSLAWFQCIQDIHHRMLQKDRRLSLQIDVTATPRHNDGAIFVQTVSDYPLVEAIHQNVVKHPVLPDQESRDKLADHKSAIFSEHYADYLNLGIEEWRKAAAQHERTGKKAVLFVMVDDTKNCDEVGNFLEKSCPELEGRVLVIHTKQNGELYEAASTSGKKKAELDKLREESNTIDTWDSPYQAIVSVLVLKEGWDVKNVTTIVGLRAYSAKSNILPEQTLGRGLRRMYRDQADKDETVSVMGTDAFMKFVESVRVEGVELEHRPMGAGTAPHDAHVVEIAFEDASKNINDLDIALPKLSRRFHRDYEPLDALDPAAFDVPRLPLQQFSLNEIREITFKLMLDGQPHHSLNLNNTGPSDFRAVVAFFAKALIKDLHLVGAYNVLYGKIKQFLRDQLFQDSPVNLEDPQVLKNLSRPEVNKLVYDTFKSGINTLTLQDAGTSVIESNDYLRVSQTRPFRTDYRDFLHAKNSPFNIIVGEAKSGGFELDFAAFLRDAKDVAAFAKNYTAVGFKLDYVKSNGDLANYLPDFLVRDTDGTVWIIETKGREELDLPQKMPRLKLWCDDATAACAKEDGTTYRFIYVDQESFGRDRPKTLSSLAAGFTEYQ